MGSVVKAGMHAATSTALASCHCHALADTHVSRLYAIRMCISTRRSHGSPAVLMPVRPAGQDLRAWHRGMLEYAFQQLRAGLHTHRRFAHATMFSNPIGAAHNATTGLPG